MAPVNWEESFINGFFALLVVLVSIFIGILILLKYRKYKAKQFLYLGIFWCGIYTAWAGAAVSFVYALFTQETIAPEIYMFLGAFFIPILLICWIYGLTEMIMKDKRKILTIIIGIYTIAYNIYLIIGLAVNSSMIGTVTGFDGKYKTISMGYLLSINMFVVVTLLLFARDLRKSTEKEPRIKGLFIVAASITYLIGGLLDAGDNPSALLIIFARTILMSGSIMFYIGLFMPKPVKKLFKLEE